MPGLPYGVVETRGNTLSVSNDPVPGHHTRGDRHESRSGLPRTPFFYAVLLHLRCIRATVIALRRLEPLAALLEFILQHHDP